MTLNISISDLRNNISKYLGKVREGNRVLIKDEKRNVTIAQILPVTSFNRESYAEVLKKSAGIFTSELHPEWRNKDDILEWLHKSRLADERNF